MSAKASNIVGGGTAHDSSTSDWPMANTQHGMLVSLVNSQQHGVIDRLMDVTINKRHADWLRRPSWSIPGGHHEWHGVSAD